MLLAADAESVWVGRAGERTVAARDFWVAYRRTARAEDELLLRVAAAPRPLAGAARAVPQGGRRRAQAISKVVMALAYRPDAGVWRDVRVAMVESPTGRFVEPVPRIRAGKAPPPRATTADHAAAALARDSS